MLDLRLDVRPNTAQRLKKVLELAPDSETFAQNIIAYQIAELNAAFLIFVWISWGLRKSISFPHRISTTSSAREKQMTAKTIWCGLGFTKCSIRMKNGCKG